MNRICFIIIVLLFFSNAVAQHRIGLTVDGATAWHLDNVEITTPKIGGNVGIGMIYQYQKGKFLLNTGVNFSSSCLSQVVDSQHIAVPMRDTEGINFIYRGELYNRQDQIATADISIPFMLGAKTSFGLYALGGVRVNLPIHAWSFQKALLTTKGDYGDRYHEMLEDLPQHGYFTALSVKNDGIIKFPIDLCIGAEFGYAIPMETRSQKTILSQIQIGAFIEYGVLNSLTNGSNLLTEVDCSQYMQVMMHHVYTTLSKQNYYVHPLSVGVRFSLLWQTHASRSFGVYWELDGQNEVCIRRTGRR